MQQVNVLVGGLAADGRKGTAILRDISRPMAVQMNRPGQAPRPDEEKVPKKRVSVGLRLLQAPFKHDGRLYYYPSASYAHLLGNNGFGDDLELMSLTNAWRN